MSRHTRLLSIVLLLLAAAWPLSSRAQWEGLTPGKVSGTGVVTIKRLPDLLRMHVQLTSQGKDMKDALAKLKARRGAVVDKLPELGAIKESIDITTPRPAVEEAARRTRMNMMVRERLRQQGQKSAKKPEAAQPVLLLLEVTADWPLKAADAEQLLIAAHGIQEKVRAEMKKLSGSEESSLEEEEMAEEMAMETRYDEDGQTKPGEPSFVYVGRISDEERTKALASAFTKAKAQAVELSKAAGAKLGPLEHLGSSASMADADDPYSPYRNRYGGMSPFTYRAMQESTSGKDGPVEAVGSDPGHVSLSVSVMASFGLQE